jgi:hypothetical protein
LTSTQSPGRRTAFTIRAVLAHGHPVGRHPGLDRRGGQARGVRAQGKEQVDPEPRRQSPDLGVRALGEFAQLSHLAQHGQAAAGALGLHQAAQRRFHRLRVGVVAVVDQDRVPGQVAPLQAALHRLVSGQALRDVGERGARGQRGRRRSQRVGQRGLSQTAHLDADPSLGRDQLEAEASLRLDPLGAHVGAGPVAEANDARGGPLRLRLDPGIVGVEHRRALRRELDQQVSLLAGATLVITPTVGRAIDASAAISPRRFIPSSTTAARCDSERRSRVSGSPN